MLYAELSSSFKNYRIMEMQDFKKHPELETEFRKSSKNYTATEIAYITRFFGGDKTIKETDFSTANLEIVKTFINENSLYHI